MTGVDQIVERHFGKRVVSSLEKNNVKFVGIQGIPLGKFAQVDTGYLLNDNGISKLMTHKQVLNFLYEMKIWKSGQI